MSHPAGKKEVSAHGCVCNAYSRERAEIAAHIAFAEGCVINCQLRQPAIKGPTRRLIGAVTQRDGPICVD